jgi:hypothetical protein
VPRRCGGLPAATVFGPGAASQQPRKFRDCQVRSPIRAREKHTLSSGRGIGQVRLPLRAASSETEPKRQALGDSYYEDRMPQVWSANVGDNAPRRRPDTVVLQMPGLRGAGRARAAGGAARGFDAAWRRAGVPVMRSLEDLVVFPAMVQDRRTTGCYRLVTGSGDMPSSHRRL